MHQQKTTRNKETLPNPNDPILTLEDLEEMNKQLEVSSSDSSPNSTPTQDLEEDLQDHPED